MGGFWRFSGLIVFFMHIDIHCVPNQKGKREIKDKIMLISNDIIILLLGVIFVNDCSCRIQNFQVLWLDQ